MGIVAAVFLIIIPSPAHAFYFYLQDKEICFPYQNGPDQATVTIFTQVFADDEPSDAILVSVKNPRGELFDTSYLSLRQLESTDVHVSEEGWYRVCVQYTKGKPSNPQGLRIELNVELKPDVDYRDPDTSVETYRTPINTLNSNIESVQREISYLTARTHRFAETATSTYKLVIGCSLASFCVLIATSLWQVYALRNLFKAKKLV